jgi:hypothetical protein
MEDDAFDDDHDDTPEYRDPDEVEQFELSGALSSA